MDNSDKTSFSGPLLPYIPRSRIDRIFDYAARSKLVYVIAGAGYGKTQAVRHYIEGQTDAVVRWVQLTENDNVGSRYWENLTHNVSLDNPELAEKMRELGFPETPAQFRQFASIQKSSEHRSLKTFLVLDDFHLIHSEQALIFAERCAYLEIPGACVIIISRKEPEINVVSLFSKGRVSIITEDELRFTDSEIAAYLKWRDIPYTPQSLAQFSEATKGWALAIVLLSMVLKRKPDNISLAIETMRQNIFSLLEMEAFSDFQERDKKLLVQLALVSDLPAVSAALDELFDGVSFIRDTPDLASFMWFDSFIGDYRVHPLYIEFLRSKQDILSAEEKRETYRLAAQWCYNNDFYTDAIYYFAQLRQFDRILGILLSYPFKLPRDSCEYFLKILENLAPDEDERGDHSFLLLQNLFVPLLLAGAGRYGEAGERSLAAIREWENSDAPFSLNLLYTAYSNLAYIGMYTCLGTHRYDFNEYMKKSLEYYKLSSIPPVEVAGSFAVADIRSFACLVGEGAELREFDEFLETARQTASYIAETSHNMYWGYDDLAASEVAYYKNQPELSRNCAYRAIVKAREKNQYSIEMAAEQYLLRIAVQDGDYSLCKEILKQLRAHLDNPNLWNRQLLYDLFTGFVYAQTGLPELVPPWLVADEQEDELHIPAMELIVCVKGYIAQKKYAYALTVLGASFPREPQERFLFGELTLLLLTAVARLGSGDATGAAEDFEKAYSVSFDGVFEMPFIELGRELQPLIAVVSKRADSFIPAEWLKTTGRKASAYAKKSAVVSNSLKMELNIGDSVQLSEREREILNDLSHGLSREEIAAIRYLSVNTVKKMLQSIYKKLGASNNADAIRIAIEKKVIE